MFLTKPAEREGVTRTAFTSSLLGDYLICYAVANPRWGGTPRKVKVQSRIDFGEHAIDYTELAKQEHMSAIELEIRKCSDKLKSIRSEHGYQVKREELFRDTSESTNSRVMWWTLFQTLILTVSAVYQIYHLKSFFKSKKLV